MAFTKAIEHKKNIEKYIAALRHLMLRVETMADATGA